MIARPPSSGYFNPSLQLHLQAGGYRVRYTRHLQRYSTSPISPHFPLPPPSVPSNRSPSLLSVFRAFASLAVFIVIEASDQQTGHNFDLQPKQLNMLGVLASMCVYVRCMVRVQSGL